MDIEKIGKFIKELRNEKGMTQEELAELIPIGREAISKWERGKNKPNKSCLEILASIFDVSVEELLLGRRLTSKKEKVSIALDLYEDRNKKQKLLHISLISIIIILFVFLGYYFINTFNSIKLYTINYSDDKITITNGIFTTTREKMYFRLGDITTKEKITKLRLYFKDVNGKDNLICETNNLNIMLYDYYGYNAYFDYYKIKDIIKNLYLDISYDNEMDTIKLDVKKDFSNNKIFYDIAKKSTEPNLYQKNINREKIKKIFKYENENYILKNYSDFLDLYYKYGLTFTEVFFSENVLNVIYDNYRNC